MFTNTNISGFLSWGGKAVRAWTWKQIFILPLPSVQTSRNSLWPRILAAPPIYCCCGPSVKHWLMMKEKNWTVKKLEQKPEFWNALVHPFFSQSYCHHSSCYPAPPEQILTRSFPNCELYTNEMAICLLIGSYHWIITCITQTFPDTSEWSLNSVTHLVQFAQTLEKDTRLHNAIIYIWTFSTWVVFKILKVLLLSTQNCIRDLLQCQTPLK